MFYWKGGTNAYTSPISEDGTYNMPKVPVGSVIITVETFRPLTVKMMGGMSGEKPKPVDTSQIPGTARYVEIPRKYADKLQSGLSYEVQKGPQTKDLDLQAG
jgi:hypothetical protein